MLGTIYHKIKDHIWMIELLLVICFAIGYFNYQQNISKFLLGTDAYYHIKFAFLTRTSGIIRDFPWAQFSLWKDHFFDKEFLYHFILQFFTFGNLLIGAKMSNIFFATIVFAVFYMILRKTPVRFPLLYTALLFSSGGFFLYRVCVTRPQILSISLALLTIYFILKRNYWLSFIFSFAYTLAYTGHYVILIYVFIFLITDYLENRNFDWKIIAFPIAGIICGWLLHPNFPNNIYGFYIQNVQVLISAWASNVNLGMGGEFFPMNTRQLIQVNTASLIVLFIAFFLNFFYKFKISFSSKFLFLLSFFYFAATLMTKRFAEYWVPLSIWFSASIISDYLDTIDLKELFNEYKLEFIAFVLLIITSVGVLFVRSNQDLLTQTRGGSLNYINTAVWMYNNIPAKEVIYTTDWDEAPYLFYINHKNYYMVFLDPNFMYHYDKNLWQTWHDLNNGKKSDKEVYPLLKNYFKTKWLFVDNTAYAFRKQLLGDPKIKLMYNGGDSSVFMLED
ncbi:MAG: hypothetical protein ABIA63_02305 [bacterium]